MSPLAIPPQRLAVESDAASISELMRISVLDLFPRFYDEQQTASAAVHIAHLDMQLINDGTYFVHEANGELVACGGWSRRNKLYSGPGDAEDDDRLLDPGSEPARVRAMFVRSDFTRRGLGRAILESCERAARDEGFKDFVLGATLPGEPLYRAFGFREVERFDVTMPDGVSVECVGMERPIGPLKTIETVQGWFNALQRGDPAPELCDPEIEIRNWAEFPIPGPYHGHDGLQRWWDDVAEVFEESQWTLKSVEAIDEDRCLTVQGIAGRFRHTGIEIDAAWGAIITVRDGKILSAFGYATPERARRAAGLDPLP